MIDKDILTSLQDLVGPMAETMGLELWGIELTGGHKQGVVRIYLDSENGVTVDQCAELSRDVSVALDVEDFVPGSYYLEVSSPGVNRPFFSPAQMSGYEGKTIQLMLKEPIDNRRKFIGKLVAIGDDDLSIEESGETFAIEWKDVKKANLRYDFPAKGKKA